MAEKANKKTLPDINKLSDMFLETLKEVSKSGNVLNSANFAQFLAKKKLIRDLLKQSKKPDEVNLKTGTTDKIKVLQEEITKHENKEKNSRKILMDLDSELDNEKDINKRTTFILLNLCRYQENPSLRTVLDEYKDLVINDGNRESRIKALNAINNQILKTDLSDPEKKENSAETGTDTVDVSDTMNSKRSMFGKILSDSSEFKLKSIKKACLKGIEELRQIIGPDFNEQISVIKDRIKQSEDFDYLLSMRKQTIGLVEGYAEKNQSEKDEITGFIKLIGTKLVEMEKEIYLTFTNTNEDIGEDIKFNDNVEEKLNGIGKSIEESTDFGSIKSIIMSGLHAITDTLNSKKTEYSRRLENSNKEKAKLQQYFGKVINSVIDQNKTLIERNQKDPLTNIYNRPTFEELFNIELQRYHRYQDTFSLMMFDIDHFKNVNDEYGHEAGDRVLRGTANCINNILRETDVFARYGGEEFVILLPKTTISKSSKVAEKLRETIKNTEFSYDNSKVPITVSVGVTEILSSDNDFQTVFNRADSYMYKAKNSGRNKVISDLNT
jgi:diguanylate cyclase (GGDEF)-like protein